MIINQRQAAAARVRERVAAALRGHLGGGHVTLVNSGTSALELALAALGLARGGRVLVPALGCDSIAMSVWSAGLVPAFYDLDDALHPILDRAADAVAIVRVHHFGLVAGELATDVTAYHRRGWRVIADCAAAFDSRQHGRHVALLADAAALSFADGKHVECGEGGAVVVIDPDVHRRVARLAGLGREPGTGDRGVVGRNLAMARPVMCELERRLDRWHIDRAERLERGTAWAALLADTPVRVLAPAAGAEVVPQKLVAHLGALSVRARERARAWAEASSVAQPWHLPLPCEKTYNAGLAVDVPQALAWKQHGLLLGVARAIAHAQLREEGAALRAIACSG